MSKNKIKELIKNNNYNFVHRKSTSSTMNEAKKFLNEHNENCIIISDKQTDGKGRRGNVWHSPKGNIYCSISFNNLNQLKDHYLYSMLISLTIKSSLEQYNSEHISFKWPNDILYKGKKIAGIISEIIQIGKVKNYLIMGFGININSSPTIENYPTSHANIFSDIENIDKFLFSFFEIFFFYSSLLISNKDVLVSFFKQSLIFLNEYIEIETSQKIFKYGIFRGINNDGSLILEINSKFENIYNGSIKL